MKKIIVVCPTQQHSYKVAEELEKLGCLHSYHTGLVYNSKNFLLKLLHYLLPKKYRNKLTKKRPKIDSKHIYSHGFLLSLFYYFLTYFDTKYIFISKFYLFYLKYFSKSFLIYLSKLDFEEIQSIVFYDYNSIFMIKQIKILYPKIKVIMEFASLPSQKLYEKLYINHFNDSSYNLKRKWYTEKNLTLFNDELLFIDHAIVPSIYIKKALIDCGFNENYITISEYGSNFNQFLNSSKDYSRINFIFIGRIEKAKGIFELLNVLEFYSKIYKFSLAIFGLNISNTNFKQYKFVNYFGQVNHSRIYDELKKSNFFILPSYWEGFSLSLLESVYCGNIPIVTEFSEGKIIDGYNGLVLDSSNLEQSLKEKLILIFENKLNYDIICENIRNSFKQNSWENYVKAITKI